MPNPKGKNQYSETGRIYTEPVAGYVTVEMKAALNAGVAKRRQTNKRFKRADAIREAISMWLVMHGE